MLDFSYVELTDQQRHERRALLDRYATIAQISALAVLICTACAIAFAERPSTRLINVDGKHRLGGKPSSTLRARAFWKRLSWRAGSPVAEGWGTIGEWVCGTLWAGWLLMLCISQTGDDILHVTKRFGIVAASLFPLHYLLAMKSPYSLIQLMTRLSHEQLNSVHQVLGRTMHAFFTLHGAFYVTWFAVNDLLATRIKDRDVILGIVSISFLHVIASSALANERRKNYRAFYITHIIIASALLPLLYFHVHHIRLFIWETLAVYMLNLVLRTIATKNYRGTFTLMSHANIISIKIPLPPAHHQNALNGRWKPGQHVYLRTASAPNRKGSSSKLLAALKTRFITNPFTIASLPSTDKHILLIARVRDGRTRQLANLASSSTSMSPLPTTAANDGRSSEIPLSLEGPYGAVSTNLCPQRLACAFDAVLFLAGGVGATFTLPLYRAVVAAAAQTASDETVRVADVRFVWAVRSLAETKWAAPFFPIDGAGAGSSGMSAEDRDASAASPTNDPEDAREAAVAANFGGMRKPEICVTRSAIRGSSTLFDAHEADAGNGAGIRPADDGPSIEMAERERLMGDSDDGIDDNHFVEGNADDLANKGKRAGTLRGARVEYARPEMSAVVREVFESAPSAGRVAVLVCGPPGMVRDARKEVGQWVLRERRDVFWHAETFGL